MNNLFKKLFCLIFFCLSFFYDIKIDFSPIIINGQNKELNGYENLEWKSPYNKNMDGFLLSNSNKNSYYQLENGISIVKNTESNKIILGYYHNQLQTVQFFYSGENSYNNIKDYITKKYNSIPIYKELSSGWSSSSWCNLNNQTYIVLYTDNKNNSILSLGDKESVDKELRYDENVGIPTASCYELNYKGGSNI